MAVAELLDNARVGRGHWRITVIIGLGLFFDLFDVFLAGVLATVLTRSFGLSQTVLPVVLGSSFLGMFVGATAMGVVADRMGRRPAFLLNLGIYSLFTLAGALSPNAMVLIVTRFLAGIGIGAQTPLSDAYLSEVLPARVRGRMMSVAYTIGFCGIPAIGLSARLMVPLAPLGMAGWRWLFVAGGLGGVLVWLLQRGVIESPRWLESKGRHEEARRAAAELLDVPVKKAQWTTEVARATPEVANAAAEAAKAIAAKAISNSEWKSHIVMLCVFQIFQTVGYYGFGTMVPLVLAHKGFSVLASLEYTTIAFLGYPIGSALSLLVVERIDRRWLIMLSAAAMAGFGLALGYATSAAMIGALGILYTLVSNIFSNAFHVLQGEIFPTAIRARAAGSAYGLSRLSSAAMPFVLLPVLNRHGAGVMFGVVAGAMGIVILNIGLFAPRTTGRRLEEIGS